MKSGLMLSLVFLAGAGGEAFAQCSEASQIQNGAGTTESAIVTFGNLSGNDAGRTAVVAGLQLFCSSNVSGVGAGPAVAGFFANRDAGFVGSGDVTIAGVTCTASGTLTGWSSSGQSVVGSTVKFVSATPDSNVPNISPLQNVSAATTDGSAGVNALSNLMSASLVCGRRAAGGPDRWQEQHRVGGQLWDYKRGPGNTVDPEKPVGTYSLSGTGTSSMVTHTYGSHSYSWTVHLQAAPNTYSFCSGGTEVVRAFIIAGGGVSGTGCGGLFP